MTTLETLNMKIAINELSFLPLLIRHILMHGLIATGF
jgi:hypothetical protein